MSARALGQDLVGRLRDRRFLAALGLRGLRRLGRGVGWYTPTVMSRRFKVLLEWDSDDHVWVAYVPTLADISTYGETRHEAIEMAREAIAGYLEAAAKEGLPVPQGDRGDIVEVEIPTP
jgi:antitoxin HicB